MNSRTDQELVREYVERHSEAAFAELVRRHIDLVHSAASRMVKDPHLAEDVTQRVFAALAQQASQLADRAVLSGWLHRTTQNLAAKTVRTEVRRRAREQEAAAMHESSSPQNESAWEHVAPHLDAALGELNDGDRDALLLRYFQRKTAREIADALGLNEEAAQKRVTRALEKLRGVFTARGVTVSTSALAGLLAMQAVQTAPAALAVSVAAASLAAGTASTFTLLSLMASTKLKLGIAAIAAAGLVTPVIVQHQQLKQLRAENAALLEQTGELESLRAENERHARQRSSNTASARDEADRLELLRLRAEVTRLGNELRQRPSALLPVRQTNAAPRETAARQAPLPYVGSASATVPDGATFAMGGWQSAAGRRAFLFVTPMLLSESEGNAGARSVVVKTRLLEFAEADLSSALLGKLATAKGQGVPGFLDGAPVFSEGDPDFEALKAREELDDGRDVTIVTTPSVVTLDGRQARVSVGQEIPTMGADGNLTNRFVGTAIDLLPRVASDGRSISVEAVLSFASPETVSAEGVQPLPRLRAVQR